MVESGRPLAGRSAWLITDGKAGTEALCYGLAERLGVVVRLVRVAPRGLPRLLAPWGPLPRAERIGTAASPLTPPWPDLVIASGRTSMPYLRALARAAGPATYRVVLQDPHLPAAAADLIWVPDHDRRRGANVVHTPTGPHRFSPQRLAALRQQLPDSIAALPHPRVMVSVGGPSKVYRYGETTTVRLARALERLAAIAGSLLITTSRRTPPAVAAAVESATLAGPRLLWSGSGDNPYPYFLAAADAFFVTADSVNMVGEAAVTGRPVHLFVPDGGSAKFDRFHAALAAAGVTRIFDADGAGGLAEWAYAPLYATELIASEIEGRWLRRRAMLPGGWIGK